MAAPRRTSSTAKPSKAKIPQLSFRDVRPAPVVLVSGPEEFFAQSAISNLRNLLRAETPELELSEVEASQYSAHELASLVTPSLFLEPRLVVVSGAHQCTDAFIEDVIAYLGQPVEDVTVVVRHASGVRGKKMLDAIRAAEGVAIEIACPKLKANELVDFVMQEMRSQRRRIEPQAASMLVAAFNADLAELASACRQLLTVTSDTITDDVVDRYYGGRVETTGFKIADAAVGGRVRDALALARHGFGTGISPVPIVAAVAAKLRLMAKVSGLGGSDAELAKIAGGAPWQVQQARRDLRDWDDARLGAAIVLVAETDHMVKGASRDAEFAVERMLRRVASRDL